MRPKIEALSKTRSDMLPQKPMAKYVEVRARVSFVVGLLNPMVGRSALLNSCVALGWRHRPYLQRSDPGDEQQLGRQVIMQLLEIGMTVSNACKVDISTAKGPAQLISAVHVLDHKSKEETTAISVQPPNI